MLNRQKTILWLLHEARRAVSHLELTKWCFLLRYQSQTGGGSSFYDFVPYRYGPFSFGLFQELLKLEEQGYVVAPRENYYATDSSLVSALKPEPSVARDVKQLLSEWEHMRQEELIDYVYNKYPRFTVNSEIKKLAERQLVDPAVYTTGYEGLSIDAFLHLLVESGMHRLIDVRNNPIARRYGFHKSTLERLTGKLGIEYVHIPELGIRSENRQNLNSRAAYERLFTDYERSTLDHQLIAIDRVCGLVETQPSVLVCMEREAGCCHRSRLALRVAKNTQLPIRHLIYADSL